jgi:putative ABC transport system permease protein
MRSVGVVVILAVAVSLSISMLIARDAVTTKINDVRAATGNTITISPEGFFGFQGGGTPLEESKVNALLSLNHVVSLEESLSADLSSSSTSLKSPTPSGFLGQRFGFGSSSSSSSNGGGFSSTSGSNTGFTLPVRVIGTNSPGTAVTGGANGGGTEKLTSGSAFSATSTKDVAVIGQNLASKNKLKVGSTFTAWKTTFTVVGIYTSGSTFADSDVLMPLAVVQKLDNASNEITSATLVVDSLNNVSGVSSKVAKALGSGATVTSTESTVNAELAPLNSVKTISTYTLLGSVIGAAVILLLSMLMIVRERRREIGVLKALGATNRSVVSQFIAESTTFTVLGSVVGLLGGIALASPITSALVNASGGASSTPIGFVRPSGGGGFGGGGFGGGGNGFSFPSGANRPSGGGFGGFRFHAFSNTLTQLHASAGWSTLVFAFVAAVVIAALGSTVASASVVRIRPAEVLRSE